MYSFNWMQKTINQLYNQIKDIKTKKEFEEEISRRHKEYDDLLDEYTVALLIVDELGRNQQNVSKINDLKQGTEVTVFGRVTGIGEERSFNRKNGSNGKVVNLELTDDTGTCGLVLWDNDADLVKNKTIQKGTNIKIINGYIKDGFTGIELNSGRWSIIEIEPEEMPIFKDEKTNNISEKVKGKIIEIESTRPFFKDSGEYGFVTNIKIKNEKGIQILTVWDEKVKEIQKFKQGDMITIRNPSIRDKNGEVEIHLNGNCKIE